MQRAKKTCITAKNQSTRVEFVKEHLNKNVAILNKGLFMDKSKYHLFGSDLGSLIFKTATFNDASSFSLGSCNQDADLAIFY